MFIYIYTGLSTITIVLSHIVCYKYTHQIYLNFKSSSQATSKKRHIGEKV